MEQITLTKQKQYAKLGDYQHDHRDPAITAKHDT